MGEQTRWIPDGTQPPKPLPLFADPLAGLVTGTTTGSGEVDADSYDLAVPVAKPVQVDREAAKAMLEAVEDDEPPPSGKPVKLPPPQAKRSAVMPGMLPEPERRPARLRVKQALGAYPRDAAKRRKQLADKRQELMAQRFGSKRAADTESSTAGDVPRRKPNSSLGGIILALVLIAIFGFIAIQVIVSIVESIGSMVD